MATGKDNELGASGRAELKGKECRQELADPVTQPAHDRFRSYCFKDSDELATAYSTWGMRLTQLRRETGRGWTSAGKLGELSFWTSSVTGTYRLNAGIPRHSVLFNLDVTASGSRRLGGMALSGDDIVVGPGGADLDSVLTGPHHGLSILVPADRLSEALQLCAPEAHHPTASPYVLSIPGTRVATLRHLASKALDVGSTAECHAASDLFDALVDTMLSSWHRQADANWRKPFHHRLHIVRRTEEYMRANLGNPVRLRDLCHAGEVSQRVLEYAFSTIYGMGPKQYLKRLRLNEVRWLLKSRPFENISAIASDHGLWHMGHFGVEYRRLFNESPSETRQRACGGAKSLAVSAASVGMAHKAAQTD